PYKPAIPGAELGITSNEAFHLETLPKTILIEGGGYIAAEFATIFNGLGVEVTLLYRGDRILRGFDEDLREGVEDGMRERGIRFRYGTNTASLEKTGTGIWVSFATREEAEFGPGLFATGRHPHTAGLGHRRD